MSAWASANPASDSRITSEGSLISFFMCAPPKMTANDSITATIFEVDAGKSESERMTHAIAEQNHCHPHRRGRGGFGVSRSSHAVAGGGSESIERRARSQACARQAWIGYCPGYEDRRLEIE